MKKQSKIRFITVVFLLVALLVSAGIFGVHYFIKSTQSRVLGEKANLINVFYSLISAQEERTYLLLLQNNTELRPTGGFIGNYGILKIKSGEITEFYIKDIYSLDRPAESRLEIIPPEPLQKYFARDKWFLRDINWSPDFSLSAHRAWTMYLLEGGKERIYGVIAINPELVNDLFDMTGGIEIDGIKYNRSNFVDTLQYEVEVGYINKGKAKNERKEVVNELAHKLVGELKSVITTNPFAFLNLIKENIREKNILVYMTDEKLQKQFSALGLTGELRNVEGDYLMVVDANLGSLKTDSAVERVIEYTVEDGIAEVAITYNHTGTPDWKTSHYRTYTRVYVPQGAKLLEHKGAMVNDTQNSGEVALYEELGKTVFGTFISINHGETRTLSLVYELPEYVLDGDYELFLQKQPGNDFTDYEVEVDGVVWEGELNEDKVLGSKK